jgi:hypothetical protein
MFRLLVDDPQTTRWLKEQGINMYTANSLLSACKTLPEAVLSSRYQSFCVVQVAVDTSLMPLLHG